MDDYHGWSGHAVLQVSVPQLESFVIERTRFYDERLVSTDPNFTHAHVTVIAPLVTWDSSILTQLARSVEPFEFRLNSVEVFEDGLIHLAPDPDQELRRLAAVARRLHPGVEAFGGQNPTPHLTLDRVSDDVSVAATAASVRSQLPVSCFASSLDLVWYGIGNCHLIDRFELGRD